MSAFVSAVIVAAGGSVRMGSAESKQFIPLLGKPAIEYTLRAFEACGLISEIVVVCRDSDAERIKTIAADSGIGKLSAVVNGGKSRAHSVKNGISAASAEAKYYAIHDGARPLITPSEIECVVKAAFESGTVKIVDENGTIESTPLRSALRAVQTPQVFDSELYSFALEKAEHRLGEFTDDCSLIEDMGGEVTVVDGSAENIKLTTPIDIVIAESILKARGES